MKKNKTTIKCGPEPLRYYIKKSKKKGCVDIYALGEVEGVVISGGKKAVKFYEPGTPIKVRQCKPFSTVLREKLGRELKENWLVYLLLAVGIIAAYVILSVTGG